MNLSLCTISFRHHLVSLEQLAYFARWQSFDGIELWGAHARSLEDQPELNATWLGRFDLEVPMLSDYLPVAAPRERLIGEVDKLARLARRWGARKIRTFAGQISSGASTSDHRKHVVSALRLASRRLAESNLLLLVETHPGTLADTLASTRRLIEEVDHPNFKLNYDVLHLWEAGDDPSLGFHELRPWIAHFHLKNVRSHADLHVFAPHNVYSAAGQREGMVPLFEGAFDYGAFLASLPHDCRIEASLEWFGDDVRGTLRRDAQAVREILGLSPHVPAFYGERPPESHKRPLPLS